VSSVRIIVNAPDGTEVEVRVPISNTVLHNPNVGVTDALDEAVDRVKNALGRKAAWS
jgi:hypothetical protein